MILERLKRGIVTESAEEMKGIATELAGMLPNSAVIGLHGDLGVGKTTFVQGLAKGFGIQENITSPTFTIFNLHRGLRSLIHLDAYRLTDSRQIDALMLDDFLVEPYCLAVEWPENIASWLPPGSLHLELSIDTSTRHWIRLK